MVSEQTKEFLNRKAGGYGLALIIIIAYISLKYGLAINIYNFIWYSIWFTVIILQGLAADLFGTNGSIWVYNSLCEIETKEIDPKDKLNLIKYHLEQAVKRYGVVFFEDIEGTFGKVLEELKRITKGIITVKELIVILMYALYDLVLRNGLIDIPVPFDVLVLFLGIVGIRIIDAGKGFTSILVKLYNEAFNKEAKQEHKLDMIGTYIKQLGALFNIHYDENTIQCIQQKETVKETQL